MMNAPPKSPGAPMGFLIVWIAVVGSVGALLAGWLLGPQAWAWPTAVSPELAAFGLLLAIVVADAAATVRRRWRR